MTNPRFVADTNDELSPWGSYHAFDQEVSGIEVGVISGHRGLNCGDGMLQT